MPAQLDPPPYDKDKDFDGQSAEYLEWCLDMADERVLQYGSEFSHHAQKAQEHIRKARSALQYRKASEGTVAHLEGLVEAAREREGIGSPHAYIEENH